MPPNESRPAGTMRLLTNDESPSLLETVRQELQGSRVCRIASAFCTRAALNLLLRPCENLLQSGGRLQFLTSVMDDFNNPSDLQHFVGELPGCEMRVYYPDDGTGAERFEKPPPPFHVKSFLFEKCDGQNALIIGSSNLTRGGFGGNREWNLYSSGEVNDMQPDGSTVFGHAVLTFDRYWEHDSVPLDARFLAAYGPRWAEAEAARRLRTDFGSVCPHTPPVPNPAQTQALESLHSRRRNGIAASAVIAATGLGKTHLAAFDFQRSGFHNVLFLAHREHILEHARTVFSEVLGQQGFGVLLGGSAPDGRQHIGDRGSSVFAMVQTLSRPEVLSLFGSRHFEYVVVDEFHHAEAATYQRVLAHFDPRFLLGITATPERMDGRDVLRLCDYDVAYEARLFAAIDQGWLTPFQYFAIHDETDFRQIRWTGIGYDEEELERGLSTDTRVDLVARNLRRFLPSCGKTKALAFCATKGHARYMARGLTARGFPATAIVSETSIDERRHVLDRLADDGDALQVVCSVDVLSEGMDVPAVTHVLLLRPTLSFTVFLQQLGRGLRRAPGKEFLVVLDLVGNSRNSYVSALALRGFHSLEEYRRAKAKAARFRLPALCHVDADVQVQRLWEDDLRRIVPARTRRDLLAETYRRLRAQIGRPPGLLDLLANPEGCDPRLFIREFGNWLRTMAAMGDLSAEDEAYLDTDAELFLQHIEGELNAVRSYKMVVLMVLLGTDPGRTVWSIMEIAEGFRRFYLEHPGMIADCSPLARAADPASVSVRKLVSLVRSMPLRHLANKPSDFFQLDLDRGTFSLRSDVAPWWRQPRFRELLLDRTRYALCAYLQRKGLPAAVRWQPTVADQGGSAAGTAGVACPDPEPRQSSAAGSFLSLSDLRPHEPFRTALPVVAELAAGDVRQGFEAPNLDAWEDFGWVRVPSRVARRGRYVVQVAGDSMQPTLDRGDLVVFEYHRRARAPGVVVAALYESSDGSGEYAVKRLRREGPKWVFASDNPAYRSLPTDGGADGGPSIMGTAVWNLTRGQRVT